MAKLQRVMDLLRENYEVPERRGRGSPVEALVRVILSQNTNDRNSGRAWGKLVKKFDGPEGIADADMEVIADAVSVAGLHNTKAKRIKKCLKKIEEKEGSLSLDFLEDMDLEESRNWLTDLPGIGPKSAAVVLNFSFGKAAFPVDTHVFRVSKRLGLITENVSRKGAHEVLEEKIPEDRMYEFHINLIKHGRKVCVARNPKCEKCFLTDACDFYQRKR